MLRLAKRARMEHISGFVSQEPAQTDIISSKGGALIEELPYGATRT